MERCIILKVVKDRTECVFRMMIISMQKKIGLRQIQYNVELDEVIYALFLYTEMNRYILR